ncbi:RHS repeat-associated core domain-containing protein [Streptomyces sp. NPDC014894]|uniref:RHS repeat-associated core domain-containing protein n=1 Tax=Streptomyces sp. NPDC014894 TaxID=3364931 RepID=UPI0036FCF8A3
MGYTIPEGVDTMLDVVGVGWPNIDEDAYRDMAGELREFAVDADDDAGAAHGHVQRLLSTGSSESLTALDKHWKKVRAKNGDLAEAARIIAGALDRVADIIVARKVAAVAELADLCATVGIALAAAPFTMGLTALLAGGKIVATRIAFKAIMKEMAEAAVAEITAVLMQPAVAALESIVTDLVIQTAMDVTGQQNGVGADGAVQAGEGGVRLNSSGGPGPGGGLGIDHDAHTSTGGRLAGVQVSMQDRAAGKIGKARGHHGRAKGRDSLTAVLDSVIEGVVERLSKAHSHLGRHVGKDLPDAIGQGSKTHRGTDQDARDSINKIKGGKRDGGGLDGLKPSSGPVSRFPKSLANAGERARELAMSLLSRRCKTDPVDVSSGEMIISQTDLVLPGILSLLLRRTHVSGYAYGHCHGVSWASSFDERLQPTGPGATWARDDGSVLVYPSLPQEPGQEVLPLEGDRFPLSLAGQSPLGDVTYAVLDPRAGLTRRFTGTPYRAGGLYWLGEIEDRNGNTVRISRAEDGLPTAVLHEGGYRVRVVTDASLGRVTALEVQTPQGMVRVASFGYDGERNLESVSGSSEVPLRFTYDGDHRVTSWTDRNGHTYSYVYDTAGRVVETIGPDGALSSRFSYDPDARVTRFTDSTGAVTITRFNSLGQTVSETDPLGHTVHFSWDRYDNLLSRTDELGNTAEFTYDERGDLVAMLLPDGRRASAVYDERHLPVSVAGPDGSVWRQAFDDRGNRISVTAPDGTSISYAHDATGACTAVTFPNGMTERRVNNPAGLTVAATDSQGATYTLTRDAFGRPCESADASGSVTRLEWTPEGWLSQRTAPDGTTESWTWDEEGNCLSHTNPVGGTVHFEYTWFDLPAARTGVDGARYEFAYDTELRITGVRNPQGLTWAYTYGPTGLVTSEKDFDGRATSYEHDAAGRLVARTTPSGHHVAMAYDTLGNLLEKNADGTVTRFTYDAGDRLTRAETPASTLVLERDAMGRLLAETVDGRTMRLSYDDQGELISRTTPTGAVTSYTYDAGGNRTRVSVNGHAIDFTRDLLGRELTRTFGPTATVTLASAWDAIGRLTNQTVSTDRQVIRSRAFGYRADGLLTSATDELSGLTTRYDLDPLGRPLKVTVEDWSERYSYDAAGNQTGAQWPDQAHHLESRGERVYEGTRLVSAGGLRYEYDEAGRVVLRQKKRLSRKPDTWRYTWDAEDRLISCTTPDGTLWRYTYDPIGRRTAKQRMAADGTTVVAAVLFCWEDTRLAEQTDLASGVTLTWDHEGYRPISQLERRTLDDGARQDQHDEVDTRFFAIVTDLIGTPTELVDEQGEVAWHNRSTVWGVTAWNRDATAYTPLRFPGQYDDPETGLHYNVYRHYDPQTARYVSSDPLGLAPAANPAAYVTNPHTWMDPEGLIAKGCTENGGWYGGLLPANERADGTRFPSAMEVNHIPPKAAWKQVIEPGFYIANKPHKKQKVNNGPAIRMERPDHKKLNSTDNDLVAQAWHQWQRELISQGRLTEAMRMDIDDIKHKFPEKYDDHIRDMVESLKDNKNLQALLTKKGWTIDEAELLR